MMMADDRVERLSTRLESQPILRRRFRKGLDWIKTPPEALGDNTLLTTNALNLNFSSLRETIQWMSTPKISVKTLEPEVKSLFKKMNHVPEEKRQPWIDAWSIRTMVSFALKRQRDSEENVRKLFKIIKRRRKEWARAASRNRLQEEEDEQEEESGEDENEPEEAEDDHEDKKGEGKGPAHGAADDKEQEEDSAGEGEGEEEEDVDAHDAIVELPGSGGSSSYGMQQKRDKLAEINAQIAELRKSLIGYLVSEPIVTAQEQNALRALKRPAKRGPKGQGKGCKGKDGEKAEDVGEAVLRMCQQLHQLLRMQVPWCQQIQQMLRIQVRIRRRQRLQMEKPVSWDAQGAGGAVEAASRAGIPATCIEESVDGHEPAAELALAELKVKAEQIRRGWSSQEDAALAAPVLPEVASTAPPAAGDEQQHANDEHEGCHDDLAAETEANQESTATATAATEANQESTATATAATDADQESTATATAATDADQECTDSPAAATNADLDDTELRELLHKASFEVKVADEDMDGINDPYWERTLQVSNDVADKWKCTKARKQLLVALITCSGDKDAFNHRMEILISSTKEGKVVINSGKSLDPLSECCHGLPRERIAAVVKYCTKNRQRKKRDKYQPDIKEYWVDTSTVGSLSTSHKEQFNQYIEILDPDCSMPVPLLENSPKPDYERETIVGQSEKLMAIHDELAEVKSETLDKISANSLELNKLTSRFTMEEKKLKRTILRSKSKKNVRAKADGDDEDDESDDEPVKGSVMDPISSEAWGLNMKRDEKIKSLLTLSYRAKKPPKDDKPGAASTALQKARGSGVNDKLLCNIAAGFMDECRDADPDIANELASSGLLSDLRRQSKTGHENESGKVFQKRGLALPVPLTYIDLGKEKQHPVLKISDMLQVLADKKKLQLFWGSTRLKTRSANLKEFWSRYRHQDAGHAIFEQHNDRLDKVLPVQIHADEGETLKKSGVMIINFQSPMGFGISTSDDVDDAMGLNYTGNTYSTRFLYTVCTKRSYSKKNKFVLDSILESLADELRDLFYNGISVQCGKEKMIMYVATLGLKGDWPVQARIGHLTRHFSKKGVYKTSNKSGFCHLCRAGETNYPPYDYSRNAAWRSSYLKELMHRFDVFHTCHKGVFAELAGSGLVVLTDYGLVGDGNFQVQLDAIYELLASHCKTKNIPLHMDGLTRNLLAFKGDYQFPVGSWFKGADTRAVCSFLQSYFESHVAQLAAPDPYLQNILAALRSANQFLETLYSSGLWLSRDRCHRAAQAGLAFMKSFLEIAHSAHRQGKTRFKLTPKLHAFLHMTEALAHAYETNRVWTWSPLADACQMDEDWIGRIAFLTTTVNRRTVHKQTLNKYLVNAARHLLGEG
ncbi:unnamed protein product [Symbiodinium sp. CCMP2592]|nr:unnamed protein product [Symbiodinium sp. CCMP2592]